MLTTRARALAEQLHAHGLSIFPVPRPQPGAPPHTPGDGKTPSLSWKRYQTTRATPARRAAWFRTEQNIAIVTGAISQIVVIDVDSPRARDWAHQHLPPTPWQTQTARGWHWYFRHPGMPVRTTAHVPIGNGALTLDLRGDGGYVIAPGSVHATGCRYRAHGDWHAPRSALPIFSPQWIDRRPARKSPGGNLPARAEGPAADPIVRARAYLRAIPRPEIGAGSDQAVLVAAARLVRGFALPAPDAIALLWAWCGHRPGWTIEWVAQKVHNAERYGTEPIGGLLA